MRLKLWAAAESSRFAVSPEPPSPAAEVTGNWEFQQDNPSGGLALHHLLRMIAYDPTATRAPRETVARLRPFVFGARLNLRRCHEAGGTVDKYAQGLAKLMDGAVSGLCHVARFCADDSATSIVPSFAVVGVGSVHQIEPTGSSTLDLLFLMPEDASARERSGRMIAFVLTGLADLGFNVNHASCMPAGAALLAEALPIPQQPLPQQSVRLGLLQPLRRPCAPPAAAGERSISPRVIVCLRTKSVTRQRL